MAAIEAADNVALFFIAIARHGLWVIGWALIAVAIVVTIFIFPGFALILAIAFVLGKMTRLI
jgi:uncharacterized membrane protein YdjX (TVP38/TMEM64 family)